MVIEIGKSKKENLHDDPNLMDALRITAQLLSEITQEEIDEAKPVAEALNVVVPTGLQYKVVIMAVAMHLHAIIISLNRKYKKEMAENDSNIRH